MWWDCRKIVVHPRHGIVVVNLLPPLQLLVTVVVVVVAAVVVVPRIGDLRHALSIGPGPARPGQGYHWKFACPARSCR